MTNDEDLFSGSFGKNKGKDTTIHVGSNAEQVSEDTGEPEPLRVFLQKDLSMYFTVAADVEFFLKALKEDGLVAWHACCHFLVLFHCSCLLWAKIC